ncbi:MAG TPA: hypothetical protein PKE69_04520 [Pyrinomonadaceae bacterium]|nr:hypothetical protein [Pyrinomonadaceae bacterium]
MNRKSISIVLLVGLLVLVFAPINVLAGTASASATAKAGDDCGEIEKKEGQNTGAMTVGKVFVGDKELKEGVDYTVENNGSTRPKIKFKTPLADKAKVKVTLTTGKRGDFTVNLTLSNC